ncbi:MAG: molybdenum cofactor biosynthesis protein MoaE [Crocinitomicaceae bacterium]|jgi:molybdopterin synthase catalytic subunit|nr:molybdenum cofactor biosynthesis protein MoaE [Crocinitomicaceae bacterium]MDG1657114.1 molybdenum cofactor biosynthesis protein MoaE [Crocinitomicaceae bacterium]MDG2440649.1 molybdenum cofactor biosynthesis protein MoaE [Crocinitomicaceae bacterium]|tara:strand:+ start:7057 stop:7485 length:429 start_codon:yes stop_codon:yes gene_type:complete
MKNCFKDGAITPEFIATSIAHHQVKTNIGAHQIFLGQVRNDLIDGKEVVAIDYSAHEEMANKAFHSIREATFDKFDLTCMHIYHSKGVVRKGEICLFVFVSSAHRKMVQQAIEYVVEAIKKDVPVFGKELFEDNSHVWKENK